MKEGYIIREQEKAHFITASVHSYVYNYTDHLGNIRLSYAKDLQNPNVLKILEENHYYPFGLKHANYNSDLLVHREYRGALGIKDPVIPEPFVPVLPYNYKYNGKELQDELGLNLYDYGARNYDPALGRFFNIDRMAESFMNYSPYQYAGNTPTFFIDVNGEYIYINDEKSGVNYRYQQGSTQKQVDGEWVNVGENDYLSDFVVCTIANLNSLGSSGGTGSGLIDKFSGADRDVTFQYRDINNGGNEAVFAGQSSVTGTQVDVNTIFFDNKVSASAFTTAGYLATPDFVTVGHEMAHLTGPREIRGLDAPWMTINGQAISKSEIRASHYENMIRAESGLPLRTYYGDSYNRSTGKPEPIAATRLIDRGWK